MIRLKLEFGNLTKEHTWHKNIKDFPKVIRRGNINWEWLAYDVDPNGKFDYVLTFSQVGNWSANYLAAAPTLEEIGGTTEANPECNCGAKHDRHFPNHHMFFCKLWGKV